MQAPPSTLTQISSIQSLTLRSRQPPLVISNSVWWGSKTNSKFATKLKTLIFVRNPLQHIAFRPRIKSSSKEGGCFAKHSRFSWGFVDLLAASENVNA